MNVKITGLFVVITTLLKMLKSWIPFEKLDWSYLSSNPNPQTAYLFYDNPEKIDWRILSQNHSPYVISFLENTLEENFDKICWGWLSRNPLATNLLEKRAEYENRVFLEPGFNENSIFNLDWDFLYYNPGAEYLLRKYPEKINKALKDNKNIHHTRTNYWRTISKEEVLKKNPKEINWYALSENPNVIDLLEKQAEKKHNNLNWYKLSESPDAIEILEKHLDKIYWYPLSSNPKATNLLYKQAKENPGTLLWGWLSANPGAIGFLPEFMDRIDWKFLSINPAIFEDEYIGMK